MSSVTRGSAPSLSAVIHSKYNKAIEKGNLFCGGYRFEAFVEGCDRNEDAGIAGLKCQLFIAGGLANKTWFYTFEGFAENNQMIVRIDETLAASIPIPPPIIRETDDEYLEQGLDPFLDPDPELTIGPVGTSHILILNKYCVLPRQLLLVSNGFQSQDEPLRFTDFCGLASTLKELKKSRDAGEHIVFYNCGRASGASQAHKHIQIVERPTELQKLFPEELNMDIGKFLPPFEFFGMPMLI